MRKTQVMTFCLPLADVFLLEVSQYRDLVHLTELFHSFPHFELPSQLGKILQFQIHSMPKLGRILAPVKTKSLFKKNYKNNTENIQPLWEIQR